MGGGKPAAAAMRACSACDGDYEDPERTAWSDADGEDAGEASSDQPEPDAARQRVPVQEE